MQKWISSHVAKDNVGQKSKGLGNRHTAPCLCYRHESKPLESHIYPSLSSPSINGYSNSFTGWSPLFVILGWKVLKKSKLGQIKGCPGEGASGCQIHHSLRQVFQKLPQYFRYHSEATQQPPWAFTSSGAPEMPVVFLWNIIRLKRRNVWFLHCCRLRVKAINLLIIRNSYIFSGVGFWEQNIENPYNCMENSIWGGRQINTDLLSHTLPTPAAKHLFSSVQCCWYH